LIENHKVYTKSDAALRIARHLSGFWPIFSLLLFVPVPLRDPIYQWIANRRYRWFGKIETCLVPSSKLQERFLD
jgi:predicted DCC family thiol-disulfide oxidoreductase YuxK